MKAMKAMAVLVAVVAAGCAGGVPDGGRGLATVPRDVLQRGETVYFGSTYRLKGADGEGPLFVYERRTDGAVATHITRTAAGELQLVDEASYDASYLLGRYTLHTDQLGRTGRIDVGETDVRFTLTDGEQVVTDSEPRTDPVVVGPTLVGFMHHRLSALRSGSVLPIRFAVLDRLETLGFQLAAVAAEPGQTKVKMSASSPLVALLVAPVFFTFDDATGNLVRIEGRVPPKVLENGRWYDLDARVEYRFVAPAYR